MEQFISKEAVATLYTISSSLAVLIFLFISRVLRKIGNVKLTLYLAIAELLALLTLGFTSSPKIAIIAFVLFMTLNPLIYLSIDIFSESLIGDNEQKTGSKRGLTLTLMSLASVMGPLTLAFIVGDDNTNLYKTYLVSAGIFSLFILIILTQFKSFADPVYRDIKVLHAIRSFWIEKDVRNVFLAHFTLQIFFAWMVIYFPLYLATEIGLSWEKIGAIIAVGLLAYVIIEYPAGIIADKYIGEKEMMAIGFLILAVTSSWIAFVDTTAILPWMVLMFVSRIGASLVESTTESYFFKHTTGGDSNIISFFRLTRPLSMIIGSLIGAVTLFFLPFSMIFIVLALLMVPGIFFTIALKDTK